MCEGTRPENPIESVEQFKLILAANVEAIGKVRETKSNENKKIRELAQLEGKVWLWNKQMILSNMANITTWIEH